MGRYSKGAKFENEVIKKLTKMGMYCIRSAGSKGIVDVVAFVRFYGETFTYFIQCKYGKAVMDKKDKAKLIQKADKYHAIPLYIYRKKYEKTINIDFLLGNIKSTKLKSMGINILDRLKL